MRDISLLNELLEAEDESTAIGALEKRGLLLTAPHKI